MDIKLNLGELFDESDIPFVLEGYKKTIIRLMREACRQVLELASENANLDYYEFVEPWMEEPINMTQDDYGNIHAINKQSILDTINQVE